MDTVAYPIVPQERWTFEEQIADWVRYRAGATDNEIAVALEKTAAYEFAHSVSGVIVRRM